jgi:hypothetical protein
MSFAEVLLLAVEAADWLVIVADLAFVGWLMWRACIRIARPLHFAFYLLHRPLALHIMRIERDHARAALEAATKISGLRADAARRRAEVTGEPHE